MIMAEIRRAADRAEAQDRLGLPIDQFGDLPDQYDPRSDHNHPRWRDGA
jgi:hypothetical protein